MCQSVCDLDKRDKVPSDVWRDRSIVVNIAHNVAGNVAEVVAFSTAEKLHVTNCVVTWVAQCLHNFSFY